MSGPHVQRGWMLYQHHRFEMAAKEFRAHLAEDPQDVQVMAMLSLCLAEMDQYGEGIRLAQQAIAYDPDEAFSFYALARNHYGMEKSKEALNAISEAVRLDPVDPDYWAYQALVYFGRKSFSEALKSADKALSLDPQHTLGGNVRNMALVATGKKQDAENSIRETLAHNPMDALSMSNLGWTQFHKGQVRDAAKSFGEALRLDPTLEYARRGLVTALKARNPLYRWMISVMIWLGNLNQTRFWMVLIAFIVGRSMLDHLGQSHPPLIPFVFVGQILLTLFVLLTWCIDPLFNLFLRLDRDGRYALSPEEKNVSDYVGILLVLSILTALTGLLLHQVSFLWAGFGIFCVVIPLNTGFKKADFFSRLISFGFAAGFFIAVVVATWLSLSPDTADQATRLASKLVTAFVIYTWVGMLVGKQK